MRDSLVAQKRNASTKGELGKIRRDDMIPGVIYGKHGGNTSIYMNQEVIKGLIKAQGENAVFELMLDNKSERVLLKEVQRDVLLGNIIHIDLQRVSDTEKVQVKVPIQLKGEERLKSRGAIAQKQMAEVNVECAAEFIPRFVTLDVSKSDIGRSVTLKEISISNNIHILDGEETVVAAIRYIKDKEYLEEVEDGMLK